MVSSLRRGKACLRGTSGGERDWEDVLCEGRRRGGLGTDGEGLRGEMGGGLGLEWGWV